MKEKIYFSENILTKEEIEKAPKSQLYYKTICENCGQIFETRLCNKGTLCKRCKCSLTQKALYKNNPQLGQERLKKRTEYNLKHYGVENSFQREDVKEKNKEIWLKKYKVDNPIKSDVIKEKMKKTCLKKYGTEWAIQNQDVQNSIKKKYVYNSIKFDSSWELAFYIFHIENGYNIKRCEKSFEYTYDNKKYLYFPDFEIDDKLYEIKGLQFFENKNCNSKMINPFDRMQDDKFEAKRRCALKNNIIFITDCKKYLDYVKEHYTENFLELFSTKLEFPYPNQDLSDTSNDGIIRHFHKSIYEANRKGQKSPLEAWYDKGLILKCALNRLRYVGSCTPEDILRGFSVAKIAQRVSLFSSSLASRLIKTHLNNYNEIVDPFSGFSGRMIGAEIEHKKYIGRDINEKHVQESNEIIKYMNLKNSQVTVEDILAKKNIEEYECLFTCPPYGGKEHWNKDNDEVEKSCDEWIDICLEKYKCEKYLFVVDKTEKYKNYIVEKLEKKSHFGNICEYVVLI